MSNVENDIKILLNLFNSGKFDLVINKTKKLIKKYPQYLILYNILGSAYQNNGNLGLAKEIFIEGHKMDPNNIAIMNNLANVYKNTGKIELSENLFKRIIDQNPNYINAYINYGNLKRDNNEFELAIKSYKKALKIDEKNPVALYSLALAYQGLGEFNLAIEFAKKTLLNDPKFTQADMLISQSQKYEIGNEHYENMNLKVHSLELNENQKTNLFFAIAKAEEDMNLIEKSSKNLIIANANRRKSLNFNIDEEVNFFNQIKKRFKNPNTTKNYNENIGEKKMIFILGMPRSGTSLVEQIITSHSNVFGAGELPQLSRIVNSKLLTDKDFSEKKINNLYENSFFTNELRIEYFSYLKRFNTTKNFITDKAPLNFRWIGIIKILFPDSIIIHCSRNPKDNCFSIFKNFFEGGMDFGYDQNELVTYYKIYLDLMNFWNDKYPDSIFEAKYERIIDDTENQTKKIIKFCNLNWEENCLKFYENKNPIKTLSTAQARKPIYKSSKNTFKKFAPFMDALNNLI